MARTSLSIVFAGSGGAGAMTAGAVLLRAAAQAGYYGLMTQLFGPQVRGGEAAALVQVSTDPIDYQPDRFDLFVAIDWEKVEQFGPEIPLDASSVIIADPGSGAVPAAIARSKALVVPLKMGDPNASKLVRGWFGERKNIFAAAAVAKLIGLEWADVDRALTKVLGPKASENSNQSALKNGIAAGTTLNLDRRLDPPKSAERWLITGNEAIGLGALRGGVRFVGCYPITPATDLVEWLAPELQRLGGRLVLAEDELASINMTLGASFGGVPAMTVTSGPGLSLMVESIGLAVAAEVPAVIVDVMRAGPSTGIPSKTEQSDINIAIYGAHGDAPHVVMAPMSIGDCLPTAEWAVYVAEALQTPVIVLSDQAMGQAQAVIDPMVRPLPQRRRVQSGGAPFKRYAVTHDPITPMPSPGTEGHQWVGEGLTHNEVGVPVSGAGAHTAQLNKRAKKIGQFDPGDWWGTEWGQGETAVVAFGSNVGPALAAARRLKAAGRALRVVGLRLLSPLPQGALTKALAGARRIIVLEQNHGAQLYRHLLGNKIIPPTAESFARPGPLPFRPGEIAALIA